MGKRWLGGVALGLSLALLLTAGCADKDCIPCYPEVTQQRVPDRYVVNLSAEITDGQAYCANLFHNGQPVSSEPECGVPGEALINASFFVTCDDPTFFLSTDTPGIGFFSGEVEDPFGEWQLAVREVPSSSQDGDVWDWLVEWLVAEYCVSQESVPEPGTIALLGSGLAGLAGYASLRWRNRK